MTTQGGIPMQWTIPGTVLQADEQDAEHIEAILQPMFLAGGMVLSQVASITGLEPYIIQNWVKRGFLSPPQNKRYTLRQLCRILIINTLKGALPMDRICGMLGYINGILNDESDDIIDDSVLYFMFVRLVSRAKELDRADHWESAIEAVLADYQEPCPGARARIAKVLRIMVVGHISSRMKQEAEMLLSELA